MPQESNGFWDDIIPQVDPERCQRCADCAAVAACLSQGILRENPDSVPYVDENVCFGCYSCVSACRYVAILQPRKR